MIHRSTHVKSNNPYDQPDIDRKLPAYYQDYDQLTELEDSTTPTMTDNGLPQRAGVAFNPDTYLPPASTKRRNFDAKAYANKITDTAVNSINTTESVNTAYADATRYTPIPDSLKPIYQTKGNTLYLNTSKLTAFEPYGASKVFEDMNGGVLIDRDLVKVTVKIRGIPGTQFSYLNKLT